MINPDIRDQAYQFFIEEAPELLQIMETGLLTLREERSKGKVHEIMRAAHSLKGGAASVELDTIKTLAHYLEDIVKAFYDEEIIIDTELESWLLQAYDCLKEPLMEKIQTGYFDEEAALATAMPILGKIEERLGDSIHQGEQYMPSSADFGIDIVSSIFEVDVAQGLERLAEVITNPQTENIAGELQAQAEVFMGFAELLNLPGFGAIAQTTIAALKRNPTEVLSISQLALADWLTGCQRVLEGDRTQGGNPSLALLALAEADAKVSLPLTPPEKLKEVGGRGQRAEDGQLCNSEVEFEDSELSQLHFPLKEEACTELGDNSSLDEVFGPSLEPLVFPQAESLSVLEFENFETPSLDEVFGGDILDLTLNPSSLEFSEAIAAPLETSPTLESVVESIERSFDSLPLLEDIPPSPAPTPLVSPSLLEKPTAQAHPENKTLSQSATKQASDQEASAPNLSVRVDFNRLERMNNLVGELAINGNSLALQNGQLQGSLKGLLSRFLRFQSMTGKLREISDKMLVEGGRWQSQYQAKGYSEFKIPSSDYNFDSLEMDSYGTIYSLLQELLEEMMQLEESVDDVVLFARTSDQTLEQQHQMLTNLRDELMWARMLPLGEVLNRFPRVLRDLSTRYHKSVKLKLSGTGVLVDKAAIEKLYDPLLHLLRNAFAHGIELPQVRQQQGKLSEGQIEIRAYHQGNQTILEISDDGQGLNFDKIAQTALKGGLLTPEQLAVTPKERLQELIFEPGFSTASQVSELSGRGVGLDVVRAQLRSLKGTVSVTSKPGEGTTFTLKLPLTLTIAKLLVCLISQESPGHTTAIALPSDSIEEIIMPNPEQIKKSGSQRFFQWQGQIIPIYPLADLIEYRCALSGSFVSKTLIAVSNPEDWGLPLLLLRRGQQLYALEVNRLVTEQELVIKPFGVVIAPPNYTYGCTILGDGTLIPVVNGSILIEQSLESGTSAITESGLSEAFPMDSLPSLTFSQTPTLLVVDDSAALRRTLALTLQKAGYRVLQARDGREALEQLQQSQDIQLVICDVEMPNMNGFEFLGQRRRDPAFVKIPVAMLTSRSSEKHRQLAAQLGANAYFTKPYIEQQFLTSIQNLLLQPTAIK